MTALTMTTSSISRNSRYNRYRRSTNSYSVTVECEDNEYYEFDVDAESYGEACSIAERRAMEMYVDIIYIQVEQTA